MYLAKLDRQHHHITLTFRAVHWIFIRQHKQYKFASITIKTFVFSQPSQHYKFASITIKTFVFSQPSQNYKFASITNITI